MKVISVPVIYLQLAMPRRKLVAVLTEFTSWSFLSKLFEVFWKKLPVVAFISSSGDELKNKTLRKKSSGCNILGSAQSWRPCLQPVPAGGLPHSWCFLPPQLSPCDQKVHVVSLLPRHVLGCLPVNFAVIDTDSSFSKVTLIQLVPQHQTSKAVKPPRQALQQSWEVFLGKV